MWIAGTRFLLRPFYSPTQRPRYARKTVLDVVNRWGGRTSRARIGRPVHPLRQNTRNTSRVSAGLGFSNVRGKECSRSRTADFDWLLASESAGTLSLKLPSNMHALSDSCFRLRWDAGNARHGRSLDAQRHRSPTRFGTKTAAGHGPGDRGLEEGFSRTRPLPTRRC